MLDAVLSASSQSTLAELFAQLAEDEQRAQQTDQRPTAPEAMPPCTTDLLARCTSDPHALAIEEQDTRTSYAELGGRVGGLQQTLKAAGVQSGDVVGVCLPRGTHSTIAMIAVMSVGATYLPLDVRYPTARLAEIYRASGARLVINTADQPCSFVEATIDVRQVRPGPLLQTEQVGAQQPGALIFTSGSTGTPKGVALSHAAISNRIAWGRKEFPYRSREPVLQRTPLSFVDSLAEVLGPLSGGAQLHVADDATVQSLAKLITALRDRHIARITLVPSLLEVLLEELKARQVTLPELRLCMVSGEPCPQSLAAQFAQLLPHVELVNVYGSTEMCADALYFRVPKSASTGPQLVPLGSALDGFHLRCVNRKGFSLPPGFVGELTVSGIGVADGYWRNSQNESSFRDGWFLSGDLAREDDSGRWHYLGRKDRQVQLRGQRVEPAEVEAALRAAGARRAAVVCPDQRLVAFYEAEQRTPAELKQSLKATLPEHFIPSELIELAALPTLPSGKTDYKQLATLAVERPAAEPIAPKLPRYAEQLAQSLRPLWSELLSTERVTPATHFFEAGGDSLLAIRMLAQVERRLGVAADLADFVAHPTLAVFAQALTRPVAMKTSGSVLCLQDGNVEDVVVCVHGDGFNLAQHIEPNVRLYWISQWSLRLRLTQLAEAVPARAIAEIGQQYAQELAAAIGRKAVPKQTRVRLIGCCAAAVVALELAKALKAQGFDVERLVLMDLPGGQLEASSWSRLKERRARSLTQSAIGFARRKIFAPKSVQRTGLEDIVRHKISHGVGLTDDEARDYTQNQLNRALTDYVPEPIAIPVRLVYSRHWRRGVQNAADAQLPEVWHQHLKGASHHFSPADHHNDLLQGDAAQFAANLLQAQEKPA